MPQQPIYLDNAATTPLEPAVFDVMKRYLLDDFGNSGSRTHGYGAVAAAAIEDGVKWVTGNKLESMAAGRMGYSTSEVGDLVAGAIAG